MVVYRLILPLLSIVFLWGCDILERPPDPPSPPTFTLEDFAPSLSCSTCHPVHYDEWKGSMHRYATNDPIWNLASNSLQQSTGGRLKNWCFQCHSPIGFLTGNTPATFQIEDLPPIVREGVNCDVCHIMRPPHTTTNQRVQYNLSPGRTKYGPIPDPAYNLAHESAYDPTFSRSEKCRECHDLISNNVPVEITFTEWQNSAWSAIGVECQDCHMERYTGQAAVGGPVRDNLTRHDFVGVDVAITDFPNKAEQLAKIDSLLKHSACMSIYFPSSVSLADSVTLEVRVCNDRTGHNLPTSVFFNRQMWIEVTVWDAIDTAYQSGHRDANGDLMNKYSALRPDEDRDLVLFGGTLYKNGQESNVFEMDSLVNNSIPPFATRSGFYTFRLPRRGVWQVRARLLFRPFAPYLFRTLNAQQYLQELPIFEMKTAMSIITVL